MPHRSHPTRQSMPSFEYIRGRARLMSRVSGAIMTFVVLAACGDSKPKDGALTSDSALGRDLALAAADSGAKPKLQDVPIVAPAATPAERAPEPKAAPKRAPRAPRPAPPAMTPAPAPKPTSGSSETKSARTTGTIAAGTTMRFEATGKMCSNKLSVGEKFTAPLATSVNGSNGAVIPAGATGTFEVVASRTAQNSSDTTYLRVKLVTLTFDGNSFGVDASTESTDTQRTRSATRSDDAKKVAGGAVAGAIIGQIIGKNTKGTVIGRCDRAAAGTAAAAATADYDTCINTGAAITVKLDAPAVVKRGAN